jgi:hypothetical protein
MTMKKTIELMVIFALAIGIATDAAAKGEKKNVPKTDDVETALKAAGAEHFPEKMDVSKVGSIESGETYYHAFCGSLREGGYRVIFMDNSGNYLGYYPTDFEPSDYEEGAVLLDSGDSDSEGNTSYFNLNVGEDGLSEKVRIDGTPVAFVKNPKNDAKAAAAAEAAKTAAAAVVDSGPIQPEYREWILINRGQKVPVRAIYIKQASGKVFLKREADGRTADFPNSMLSEEDQEYVKKLE